MFKKGIMNKQKIFSFNNMLINNEIIYDIDDVWYDNIHRHSIQYSLIHRHSIQYSLIHLC